MGKKTDLGRGFSELTQKLELSHVSCIPFPGIPHSDIPSL